MHVKSRSKSCIRSTVMRSKFSGHVTARTPVSSAHTKQALYKHTTYYSNKVNDQNSTVAITCYYCYRPFCPTANIVFLDLLSQASKPVWLESKFGPFKILLRPNTTWYFSCVAQFSV